MNLPARRSVIVQGVRPKVLETMREVNHTRTRWTWKVSYPSRNRLAVMAVTPGAGYVHGFGYVRPEIETRHTIAGRANARSAAACPILMGNISARPRHGHAGVPQPALGARPQHRESRAPPAQGTDAPVLDD